MSCCTEEDKKTFDKRTEGVAQQITAPFYDCESKKIIEGTDGFTRVDEHGNTPGIETNAEYLNVLDTRAYISICNQHLADAQCLRCSQDHDAILGRRGMKTLGMSQDNTTVPFFYMHAPDATNDNPMGRPFVVCREYWRELVNFCQYSFVRNKTFSKLFHAEHEGFIGITGNPLGPVTRDDVLIIADDMKDSLIISNQNCYRRPLPLGCGPVVNPDELKFSFDRQVGGGLKGDFASERLPI
eukprot:gene4254-4964_t